MHFAKYIAFISFYKDKQTKNVVWAKIQKYVHHDAFKDQKNINKCYCPNPSTTTIADESSKLVVNLLTTGIIHLAALVSCILLVIIIDTNQSSHHVSLLLLLIVSKYTYSSKLKDSPL